jgi:hypothetical protein
MAANIAKPFWQMYCADAYGYCPRSPAFKSEIDFAFAAALGHALQDHTPL